MIKRESTLITWKYPDFKFLIEKNWLIFNRHKHFNSFQEYFESKNLPKKIILRFLKLKYLDRWNASITNRAPWQLKWHNMGDSPGINGRLVTSYRIFWFIIEMHEFVTTKSRKWTKFILKLVQRRMLSRISCGLLHVYTGT